MAKSGAEAQFGKIEAQLQALHDEVGLLSKKKPDDAVNKFKLTLINQVLTDANEVLTDAYQPFADFSIFNEDDMPTNSDVVLILSQYIKCMRRQRVDGDPLLNI